MPASTSIWASLQPQEPATAEHTTALKAAPSRAPARVLLECTLSAEEEEEEGTEAKPNGKVGNDHRHGNLLYLPSNEENFPKSWHFAARGLTSGGI